MLTIVPAVIAHSLSMQKKNTIEDATVGTLAVLLLAITCIGGYYGYWRIYAGSRDSETDELDRGGVVRVGEETETDDGTPLMQDRPHYESDEYVTMECDDLDTNTNTNALTSYVSFSAYGVYGSNSDRSQTYLPYDKL